MLAFVSKLGSLCFHAILRWDIQSLRYEFGHGAVPEDLVEGVQQVVHGIIVAQRCRGSQLVLEPGLQAAARHLEILGVVTCTGPGPTTAALTKSAEASIYVTAVLANPRKALTPRSGMAVEDLSAFELMAKLHSEGWTCAVAPPGTRKNNLAYNALAAKSPKTWYVRTKQTGVQRSYLLALATACNHKQAVLPFMTEKYYKTILAGDVRTSMCKNSVQCVVYIFVLIDGFTD